MFQSMNRILRWTKGYHRRLYLGSLCSFLATWAAAGPVMLAAWALGLVIESAQEGTALDAKLPWLCLGGIILLIVLRFVCAYWKNRLQESIGTERAAQQRLELGDLLKRVSLGYFSKNTETFREIKFQHKILIEREVVYLDVEQIPLPVGPIGTFANFRR